MENKKTRGYPKKTHGVKLGWSLFIIMEVNKG